MDRTEIREKSRIEGKRYALTIAAGLVALTIGLFAGVRTAAGGGGAPIYKNVKAPMEKRIDDLIGHMTLEEKIAIIRGDKEPGNYVVDTGAVPRLGIPALKMTDGPNGVRWGTNTAFPTGVAMASTWNEELIDRLGVALGEETIATGRHVIFGPCVNIHRVPFGGRNFESFSEDPYLAGRIAVGYIRGVQRTHAIATVKHFAMNNQEIQRNSISVETDERTLQEMYLPQFKAAVQEGGSLMLMCSYNRINSVFACENKHLLTDILKNDWGFKGIVISDYNAVHNTVSTALSGMDVEMPTIYYAEDKLGPAVRDGQVPMSVIDDKVRRVLRVLMTTGIFDNRVKSDPAWVDSAAHRAVALDVAREGIVLLKNNGGILPLDRKRVRKIAVIGPNARVSIYTGWGSAEVSPSRTTPPLDEIVRLAGRGIEVRYAPGCDIQMPVEAEIIPEEFFRQPSGAAKGVLAEYFMNPSLKGQPEVSRAEEQVDFTWDNNTPAFPDITSNNLSVRWSGLLIPPATGKYRFIMLNTNIVQLFVDGKMKLNNMVGDPGKLKTFEMEMTAGQAYKFRVDYQSAGGNPMVRLGWVRPDVSPIEAAVRAARESDVAIVFAGLDKRFEGEDHDRGDLELPGLQNELIERVAAANPKTVVVLQNGTPLIMKRWLDKVPGLIEAWYPGEEGGRAIAEILFGDVNPSGRLPVTIPNSWEESPAYGNYPGKDGKVYYKEGIFVGYRYYDTKRIAPVFPFGYGLSYTTFRYSGLKIEPATMTARDKRVKVSVTITNTGRRAGKETAQLYVRDVASSVPRPVHELKGIRKISLAPGESRKVTFTLDRGAFSFFDPKTNRWKAEPGQFVIQVGASSRDIRVTGNMTLK